ncbi:type II secretion system protein [Alkalibacillus almallahensis]|uniref:type II secretion system protein n=1 Tax=Alkalibacillus almallahensis TaxID=1379154 RepID=UPI00142227CC|nr:type II secretion system protein [Alkalibacillus almallahensis]NIK11590.1 type IV pilus assembly protein PilA [Alkalibacillus almallahensis]
MLKRILKNQKGITLVELLAVIVILGIIALIAVPAIANVIEDSRYDSVKSTAINVIESAELYATTNDVEENGENEVIVGLDTLSDNDYIDTSSFDDNTTLGDVTVNVTETPFTINGTLDDGNVSINFSNATVQDINDANASDLRNDSEGGTASISGS